jgi:hypothetical protein
MATAIVVSLIVLLAGLIIPVFFMQVERSHVPSQCGKNMSQLMGAVSAYRDAEDNAWPLPVPMPGRQTLDAHAARQVTCRLFAVLVRSQNVPPDLLRCPPTGRPAPPALTRAPTPVDWGMSEAGVVGYALDWACPADPGWERVVMADRDPLAHHGGVMACFGDCHVKKLKTAPVATARRVTVLVTESVDGRPVSVGAGHPGAKGDDLYSDEGDAGEVDPEDADFLFDPLSPGQGDPLRAWVK